MLTREGARSWQAPRASIFYTLPDRMYRMKWTQAEGRYRLQRWRLVCYQSLRARQLEDRAKKLGVLGGLPDSPALEHALLHEDGLVDGHSVICPKERA